MATYSIRAAAAVAMRSDTKTVARIQALADQIRGDLWNRWLAIAQKRALIWWRDRSTPPGLKARFTTQGIHYYGFGRRGRKPSTLYPYYHVTGALQRALLARKPRTKQASKNGGVVQTLLKFGGLSLNLMTTTSKPDMRPVVGVAKNIRTMTESFHVGSYVRTLRSGGSITVAAYDMTRQRSVTKTTLVRGGETHAALFGKFTRDAPAIQARVAIEMRRIIRASAYDKRTGLFKSSVVRPVELQEAVT